MFILCMTTCSGNHLRRRLFATKCLHGVALIADRFEREAMAWLKLDLHPNITQARMVERIEGKPFLFLEYVSGGDLGAWIDTPALKEDLPQVLRFAVQFCDGMIHAFSKGVRVHRDIKPRNCLITKDNVLKVTDFGLAKLFDEDVSSEGLRHASPNLGLSLCNNHGHMHTYRPRNRKFTNSATVDVRADVYSFGVMLFQMVSGHLPFCGDSWKDLEQMHRSQNPPLLATTDPQLSLLVQKCMAKDPAQRPADFRQVRQRLSPIYQRIIGSTPPLPVQGTALSAVQLNNKGSSLDNLGLRAEAIACFDAAIQLNPSLESAWFNKGVALLGAGRADEGLACYDRAIKINPSSEKVWSNKGVVLKRMGKTEEAIACYDHAIKINPRYANAWVNKSVALKVLNRTEEALACYDRALTLNPKDQSAWTNKGNILYTLKRWDEAVVCYERALELNPKLDRTWMNKGIALNAIGRHQDALDCYGRGH